MAIWVPSRLINPPYLGSCSSLWSSSSSDRNWRLKVRPCLAPANCTPPLQENLGTLQQRHDDDREVNVGIMCEPCNGRGWLLCDFCGGQKTNVATDSNRIYRRCPSCRAIGYVLCSKCKVFKCVTFPDFSDGEL